MAYSLHIFDRTMHDSMRGFRLNRAAVTVAACLGVLVSACYSDPTVAPDDHPVAAPVAPTPARPVASLASLVPAGGVQAAILEDAPAADGSVTFTVRVVAKDVGVSAYQGAVTFAPGTLQAQSFAVPPGDGNEVYAVNPAEFAAGRIRFAACSATTFAGTDVGDGVVAFRFTVRAQSNFGAANIGVGLTVVGTESGAGIAAEHVLQSTGVLSAQR